jgi:hypothetical protein
MGIKAAALAAHAGSRLPDRGATRVNAAAATVELIVSMTGMPDDVGNIVMPGAFESSLPRRQPKVVLGHD